MKCQIRILSIFHQLNLFKVVNVKKAIYVYTWFCLFVLKFYGPVNPMGSCRAWSVYLTTVYWAGLVL